MFGCRPASVPRPTPRMEGSWPSQRLPRRRRNRTSRRAGRLRPRRRASASLAASRIRASVPPRPAPPRGSASPCGEGWAARPFQEPRRSESAARHRRRRRRLRRRRWRRRCLFRRWGRRRWRRRRRRRRRRAPEVVVYAHAQDVGAHVARRGDDGEAVAGRRRTADVAEVARLAGARGAPIWRGRLICLAPRDFGGFATPRGSVATANTASLFAGSAGGGAPLDRRTRGASRRPDLLLTPPFGCAPHAATTGRRIRDCASFA